MRAFLRELRDRHVVKVALAYLVIAWLLLQFADVVFPALQLPEWTVTLALALLALGFPLAVVLAWVFDFTPTGIERTDSAGAKKRVGAASPADAGHAIAVLPLCDMSAEQDQQHFCDGLTEELLNVLTRIPKLRVASRTSAFAFKGRELDIAAVAEKLHVTHILEGSVRKSGNKVRITAQLIEVATDSHLWSEHYDRELCDIFAIQDDIAARILNALKLKLAAGSLSDPTTSDPKAYEYYLRGRGYFLTKTGKDNRRAMDMLRKAVAIDPEFVRAWIGLAEVSAINAIFLDGGLESLRITEDASAHAMQLAPNRAASHMARGFAHLAKQRFAEAERVFQIAVDMDPALIEAWHYLARAAMHQGDKEKTRDYFMRATEASEEDWESPLLAIGTYEALHDLEGARRMARIGVERAARHLEDYPDNPRAYYLCLAAFKLLDNMKQARRYAEKALAIAPDDPPTRYNLACFHAQIGEADKALDLLEGSIQSRSWIENDPDLDSIRCHPRYQAVVAALPE